MKRLFIVSRHPMFGEGLEAILCQNVEIIILGREQDLAKAIERIGELQPDIVIVDCNDEQINISSAMIPILQRGVKTKVIGLDLNTNTIFIHTLDEHEVKEVDDLLKALE